MIQKKFPKRFIKCGLALKTLEASQEVLTVAVT